MSLTVTTTGSELLLAAALGQATPEDLTLKLFSACSAAPSSSSVVGDFTESAFTGYSSTTLTKTSWSVANVSGVATGSYAQQSWTCGATGGNVAGYFVVGATSGTLYFAEQFSTVRTLTNGSVYDLTPSLSAQST